MYSNVVKAARDILTDRGYEFHITMCDRLQDLESRWTGRTRLMADDLAKEYHRLYHEDLKHAVFVLKTPAAEKNNK